MSNSKLFVVDFRNVGSVEAKILDVTGVVEVRRSGNSSNDVVTTVSASDGNDYEVGYYTNKAPYHHDYEYFTCSYNENRMGYKDMSMEAYFKVFLSNVIGCLCSYLRLHRVELLMDKGVVSSKVVIIEERYLSLCDLIQAKANNDRFIVLSLFTEIDDITVTKGYTTAVEPDMKADDGSWIVFEMFEFMTPAEGEVIDVYDPEGNRFFVTRAADTVMADCSVAEHMVKVVNDQFNLKFSKDKIDWNVAGADKLFTYK